MSAPFADQSSIPAPAEPPLLLSAEDLAQQLGISTRTLWRLRSAGQLPKALRLGGSVRWSADEIRRWVSAGCPRLKDWEARQPLDRPKQ